MIRENGFVVLDEKPDASVRLLCFHHAGGSALSLMPVVRDIKGDVEVCLFELPGRGMLQEEEHLSNFEEARDYLLERVNECIDRPCVIFGHSLGGLLAYSVAASLDEEKVKYLKRVVISASRSPHTVSEHAQHPKEPFILRSFQSVKDDMMRLGGMPLELLEDEELLNNAVETTGRDFHMLDTFRENEKCVLEMPIELWLGNTDEAVDLSEVSKWKKVTGGGFEDIVYSGGHFYLFESNEPSDRLRTLLELEVENESRVKVRRLSI